MRVLYCILFYSRQCINPGFYFFRAAIRSVVSLGGAIAVCAVRPVLADSTLTLQLPPSQAALEAQAAERAAARARAAAATTPPSSMAPERYRESPASRGGLVRRPQTEVLHTVGRLGLLMQKAAIYRHRSRRSPILTTPMEGTYLAIQQEEADWYGVLMADGSTGWVPASAVRKLDYQVEAAGSYHVSPMSGLPGYSAADDIYPRSSNPYFGGDAQSLLKEAYKYLGVPYVWGGNTVHGLDCSGFIKKVFGAIGYNLPRLGSDQMAYGVPVPVEQLQAGDRLYFGRRTDRVGVTHTGLYIGNGYFIHASSGKHGVAISQLSEPLFRRIYVCARR